MQIGHQLLVIVMFVMGFAFFIAANFVVYPIFGEVNARRPPESQYPQWSFRLRFFEIWGEHERLFPRSRRRLQFVVFLLAGAAWCLTGFCVDVFGH